MKKELTEKEIINWWLEKYHNTDIDKVAAEHPDWGEGKPGYNSRMFYDAYPVTEAQHDEWRAWLVKKMMWFTGRGKKYVERNLWAVYLNTAPIVKYHDNKEDI